MCSFLDIYLVGNDESSLSLDVVLKSLITIFRLIPLDVSGFFCWFVYYLMRNSENQRLLAVIILEAIANPSVFNKLRRQVSSSPRFLLVRVS